jgi:hypothetical protein
LTRRRDRAPRILSRSASLTRKVGIYPVKKTVVVVCKGTKTEPQYIEMLADEPDVRDLASVALRLEAADEAEVPRTLVRRAIDLKNRTRKESGEIDEIWCVFDVE